MPIGIPITKELEKTVIDYYLSKPMSLNMVCEKFNLCSPTVARILNDNNVVRDKKNVLFNPNIKEDYF